MNWVSFSERRPEAEPNPEREILVRWDNGRYVVVVASTDIHEKWTDWCEIEPPLTKEQEEANAAEIAAGRLPFSPPKPDPFEEWWKILKGEG